MPFRFQLPYIAAAKVNAAITEFHIIVVDGRNLWESSNPTVLLRAESSRTGHSGQRQRPVRFQMSPRTWTLV